MPDAQNEPREGVSRAQLKFLARIAKEHGAEDLPFIEALDMLNHLMIDEHMSRTHEDFWPEAD